MNEQELTQEILDYMTSLYNAEYKGLFEVTKNENIYTLTMGLPSYMSPTTITFESETDEGFLDFIKEEIRIRNYMRLYIYKVIREDHKNEEKK